MPFSRAALAAFLAAALATPAAAAVTLEPAWTLVGLRDPESVAISADGTFLYVTNVAGEGDAKDGDGSVWRVSLDGKLIEHDWAMGLNAPKGAIVRGDVLLVSDVTDLVSLDARTGEARARLALPGARFLNDVAVAPDGTILVADSAGQKIYAVVDGEPSVWAEGPDLSAVNGLLPEPDRLVVTTMAGKLLAMDYATRNVTLLAGGLGDADGVAALGGGAYLVSAWPGQLFEVGPDGAARELVNTVAQERYINDFILVGDTLFIPHWKPGALSAHKVVRQP